METFMNQKHGESQENEEKVESYSEEVRKNKK